MNKRWIALIVVIGCTAALLFALLGRKPAKINLLLVSLDTVRPDHLGCYGYDEIETPVIDRIASKGLVFTDALTSVPVTLPSHASVFTGLYPTAHGVRENEIYVLSPEFTTLAEILADQGYRTGAFVGSFVLDSRYGLAQGFDTYDDVFTEGIDVGSFEPPERRAGTVNKAACRWLEGVDEPFFAFVHYYDAHDPYDPPPPYDSLYAARPYDGEIAYADRALGEVMHVLDGGKLLERTLVVVISDHGEGLGQHDEPYHGILVYDTTLRTVLIIRVPAEHELAGSIEAPRHIDQTVELIDVLPTVLDLLGLDPVRGIDGRDLVPLLKGERLPTKVCYQETMLPYLAFRWSPLRGVRFGGWKYTLAPEEELYNLVEDPGETSNLYPVQRAKADELKTALLAIMSSEKARPTPPEAGISPEEAQKLRALGYVSTSKAPIPTDTRPEGMDPKRIIRQYYKLTDEGKEAAARGDYRAAARAYRRLVDIDPGNPKSHMELGTVLIELGDLSQAEVELVKASKLDSLDSGTFMHLASVARTKGELERALFFYRVASDIMPETPEVFSKTGAVLLEMGLVDSAMAALDQALAIDPNDAVALVNIGVAHLSMKDYESAAHWFRRTLKADPENLKALMNIAFLFIQWNQPDSTIAYLERARSVAPNDPKVLLNLGNSYRQKGMVAEAAECFETAAELEPDNVLVLFGLAATKAAQGETEESIGILRKITEIDPDFAPARQALERMTH